jgi:hypothetical protein
MVATDGVCFLVGPPSIQSHCFNRRSCCVSSVVGATTRQPLNLQFWALPCPFVMEYLAAVAATCYCIAVYDTTLRIWAADSHYVSLITRRVDDDCVSDLAWL